MKKISAVLVSLTLLAGCATVIEGQTQPFTILTPGANDAECTVHNKDMSYIMRTGETRLIMKSNNDLTIDCLAPGNRKRTVIVDTQLEPTALANVTNGVVPGTTYDHFSRGLYAYPETISIDFSGVKGEAYPMPDYMKPEARDVYKGEMEYYGATTGALPSDTYATQGVIQKRTGGRLTDSPFGSLTPTSGATGTGQPNAAPLPITEK